MHNSMYIHAISSGFFPRNMVSCKKGGDAMDAQKVEKEIVTSFFLKNKQERLLWELGNPKKREKFFWNLAGTGFLKQECLNPMTWRSAEELERVLFGMGKTKSVYYMGGLFFGETSLHQAVQYAAQEDLCIIYCGNGSGYYQGEPNAKAEHRKLLTALKI